VAKKRVWVKNLFITTLNYGLNLLGVQPVADSKNKIAGKKPATSKEIVNLKPTTEVVRKMVTPPAGSKSRPLKRPAPVTQVVDQPIQSQVPTKLAPNKNNKVMNEQTMKNKYRIFCDMDGVLVDFDKGYEDLTGLHTKHADVQDSNDFWNKFREGLKEKNIHVPLIFCGNSQEWESVSPTIFLGNLQKPLAPFQVKELLEKIYLPH
jgi:hypothetical protein